MECYTYLRNVHRFIVWWEDALWKTFWENHLKDRLFHLVHWLSITLNLRRTSPESINLERKFYLDCSSDTLSTRKEIWKGDVLIADLEELETMDASEIYSKSLNAKEVIFPKEGRIYFSQSQMDESKHPEKIQELRTSTLVRAASNSRRGSRWLSWRIRRIFSTTSWLTSGCRWSNERLLVHVGKLHITAITLNPESNFTRREKNHSLFHWSTLTLPETTHTNLDVKLQHTSHVTLSRWLTFSDAHDAWLKS